MIRPLKSYQLVYPFDIKSHNELAYFFDYDYPDDRDVDKYILRLSKEISIWIELWNKQKPPGLTMVNT